MELGAGPTLYCTICGGPVHGRTDPCYFPNSKLSLSPKSKWLGEAILLSSSGELEDCLSPSVLEVTLLDVHCLIKGTPAIVRPLDLRRDPFHTSPPRSRLYFPCHKSCLLVAQKALVQYEQYPLRCIWKTLILRVRQLEKRCQPGLYHFRLEPPVKWPGIWKLQGWEWQAKDCDEESSVNSIPFSQPTSDFAQGV